MSRVNRSNDCGNSPKNMFAQEIAIAIEKGDAAFLGEALVEDATCSLADGAEVSRDEFLNGLKSGRTKPTTISVDRVVTHGKAGAVDGVSKMDRTVRRFCHVIHFANAKGDRVNCISSYGKPA